jgi:hypothetical protein
VQRLEHLFLRDRISVSVADGRNLPFCWVLAGRLLPLTLEPDGDPAVDGGGSAAVRMALERTDGAPQATAIAESLRLADCGDVMADASRRAQYSTDASNYRHVPVAVVFPRTRAHVITSGLDSGCCGLAGNLGAAAADTVILADGFSCRIQITQHSERSAAHLAELIAGAIDGSARPRDHQ